LTTTAFWSAGLALVLTAAFTIIGIFAQFSRRDLSVIHSPMTHYLRGPGGAITRAGYACLMGALVAFGVSTLLAGHTDWLGITSTSLFVAAGLALIAVDATTGAALPDITLRPRNHVLIHRYAAVLAFFFAIGGILTTSWTSDSSGPAIAVRQVTSLVCCALFLVMLFLRTSPKGLTQKFLILSVASWLMIVTAQFCLMRVPL
jgi:hypothetical protein